jgi:hypothetical protein
MGQRYSSQREAQRAADRQTGNGRLHQVEARRGLFGTKYTVKDTGKIANPVQRREARLRG